MSNSDAPSFGITYDPRSDNSSDVIYNCNIFIIQATVYNIQMAYAQIPMSRVGNLVQVLSCQLKFLRAQMEKIYYCWANQGVSVIYNQKAPKS